MRRCGSIAALTTVYGALLAWGCGTSLAAHGAAGVVAAVQGRVTVERTGAGAIAAELGMRLEAGDTVRVAEAGAASIYLVGGGVRRLLAGEKLALARTKDRDAALPSPALRLSEAGLWVLNDPDGSVLMAAMRGGEFDDEQRPGSAELLSPRYEALPPGASPRFHASGGARPAVIVVASGKDAVLRSAPLSGDGPWAFDDASTLPSGSAYSWRLESAGNGAPLSGWVPFRIAPAADAQRARSFEDEIRSFAGSPDGSGAADLLRCGYYLETKSWTPLLAAALRLIDATPGSQVAQRARAAALRGMRLDPDSAAELERRLRS